MLRAYQVLFKKSSVNYIMLDTVYDVKLHLHAVPLTGIMSGDTR